MLMLAVSVGIFATQEARRPEPDGFVGGKVCSGCHAEISEPFQELGMAKALYRPSHENTVEDYIRNNSFYHKKSGFHYKMVQRDGKFFQQRYVLDSRGEPAHVHEEEISYVVGSGNHARSYLRHHPNGVITQLPVTWYSSQGRWDMSPGYDREHHPDFTRAVPHECIFCHGSYPRLDPETADDQEYFPYSLTEGIGCERCHGPGQRHVELATRAAAEEEVRKAIYNPAYDSKEAQRAVCYQCHQETVVNGLATRVLRPGRTTFSYRPGEPFSSYAINLKVEGLESETGSFHLVQHADLMELSKCFTASGGEMTCTTCHDPHFKVKSDEGPSHYRKRCLQCHDPTKLSSHSGAQLAGDCTVCHMPGGEPADAAHTVFTNHRIGVYPPRHSNPSRRSEPYTLVLEPDQARISGPEEIFFRGAGYLSAPLTELLDHPEQARKGIELLERYISQAPPQTDRLYLARAHSLIGKGYQAAGPPQDAINAYEQSIRFLGNQLQPLYNLGLLYASRGELTKSKHFFEKVLAAYPLFVPAMHALGALADAGGEQGKAIEYFNRAIDLFPGALSSHGQLAQIYFRRQNWSQALEHLEQVMKLDPNNREAQAGIEELRKRVRPATQ